MYTQARPEVLQCTWAPPGAKVIDGGTQRNISTPFPSHTWTLVLRMGMRPSWHETMHKAACLDDVPWAGAPTSGKGAFLAVCLSDFWAAAQGAVDNNG